MSTTSPLQETTHTFTFTYDRPLKCTATKFYHTATPEHDGITLLFVTGVGLDQGVWVPTIRELFRLARQPNSTLKINSAWLFERPNHGDPALMNAEELKNYTEIFLSWQYGAAIHALITSDKFTDAERSRLFAITFSGGSASFVQTLRWLYERDGRPITLKGLIFVESPYLDPSDQPSFEAVYPTIKKLTEYRRRNWASVEEAVKWFRSRIPWKEFHPDVWEVFAATSFCQDPQHPDRVIFKTPPEQEYLSFLTDGSSFESLPYLRTIWDKFPLHLILGGKRDFWPELQGAMKSNIERDRKHFKTVTVVDGVGHYIPAVKPYELANHVFNILSSEVKSNPKL
ncbi:hypothetical protein VNI00_014326 [Paramarasmius palmivorus]|uniref:AB hydrolase-1 domain-containing protein n=1 Tax=Paramarasmius palmivorus TaxID=297713 RepID=A0AAW0BSF9_9AGAR